MKELPEDYDLKQAYNDILGLAHIVADLKEFVDNVWDCVRDENFIQENLFSLQIDRRMEELELKLDGLVNNYASKYPLFDKIERQDKKKVDKQGKYNKYKE